MNISIREVGEKKYLEGPVGSPLLLRAEDVASVVETCFSNRVNRLLLHTENFTEKFFDLSSGDAGTVLQKLRTYHIRVAAVLPMEKMTHGKFGQMIAEENRGPYFRGFESRADAEAWLVSE